MKKPNLKNIWQFVIIINLLSFFVWLLIFLTMYGPIVLPDILERSLSFWLAILDIVFLIGLLIFTSTKYYKEDQILLLFIGLTPVAQALLRLVTFRLIIEIYGSPSFLVGFYEILFLLVSIGIFLVLYLPINLGRLLYKKIKS